MASSTKKRRYAKERAQRHKIQSPETKKDHKRAHPEQVQRMNLKDGTAADQFFEINPGEDIHHIRQPRLFDGLFANTTPEQAKILAKELGSGNRIENLMGVYKKVHQGKGESSEMAVHNLLRERGLTTEAAQSKIHPLIQEFEMAHTSDFAYKLHLAKRFHKELKPKIDDALNDALTYYHAPHLLEAKPYELEQVRLNSAKRHLL